MTGLLTAYGPFQGREMNQSLRVLEALEHESSFPESWKREVWPVRLPEVRQRVQETMAHPPAVWLALGESGQELPCRLETRGHNRFDLEHDEASADGGPASGNLLPQGPTALRAHWPFDALAMALQTQGHAVELSADAGSHCCNALLYLATLEAQKQTCRPWVGFLHLTRQPEDTEVQVQLVLDAVGWLHKNAPSFSDLA
jgi:pyroglutamyl-peptidase